MPSLLVLVFVIVVLVVVILAAVLLVALEFAVSPLKLISCFPAARGLRNNQLPSATACVVVLAGNPILSSGIFSIQIQEYLLHRYWPVIE